MFTRNIIVFDVESTGLDEKEYSMCEIGAVFLDNVKYDVHNEFHTPNYIQPIYDNFLPQAMNTHKIPKDVLMSAPHLEEAIENFEKWVASVADDHHITLASWGTWLDMAFLKYGYQYLGRDFEFDYHVIDLRTFAQAYVHFILHEKTGNMAVCAKALELDVPEQLHRALTDAKLAAAIMKIVALNMYKLSIY